MKTFESRDEIEAWLKDRPPEDAVVLAARAALRVMPLLVTALDSDTAERRAMILLPSLRATSASWLAGKWSSLGAEVFPAARAAGAAARKAFYAARDANTRAAADAASSADAAVRVVFAADGAARAAANAADRAAAADAGVFAAIAADATALEHGANTETIAGSPLWPEGQQNWVVECWGKLKNHLLAEAADEHWEVWTDWYEARLMGEPSEKNPDGVEPDLKLERARVLISDKTWEKGPKAVNKEIASLIEMAERGEIPDAWPVESDLSLEGVAASVSELKRQLSALETSPRQLAELSNQVSELERALRAAEDRSGKLQEQLAEYHKDAETIRGNHWQEGQTLIDNFEKQIGDLAESYLASTTFEAPVELWKIKEVEHDERRKTAFRLFVSALGIGLVAAAVSLMALLDPKGNFDQLLSSTGGLGPRGVIVIGTSLAMFTLLLWFTRLQMRIFLSERHLALDARERRAFAQAYVAMLRGEAVKLDDESLSSEERSAIASEAAAQKQLVYAALFRPTQDGIVKEDGGLDPSLSAAISRILSK